jgi:hypothetical protein
MVRLTQIESLLWEETLSKICPADRARPSDDVLLDVAPEHGGVLQVAYTLIYHLQMNALDLPRRSQLSSRRRGRVSKDVLDLGNATVKRTLTWSFTDGQLVAGERPILRAVMLGTMGHEHFNALVRGSCFGDDPTAASTARRRGRIFAACRRCRGLAQHVQVPRFGGVDVPSLSSIVQCVVLMLARLGIEIAASMQTMLDAYEMMPDVGAWTSPRCFTSSS